MTSAPKNSSTPPPPPQCLEVALLKDGGIYVKVVGIGNQHLAPTVQGFVETSIDEGHVRCALDLSSCTGLDSTFMGTIVMLAGALEETGGQLCLINVGDANSRLLQMLGVWEFVRIRQNFPMEPIETMRISPVADTRLRIRQIVNAHKSLVAIDERNQERFGRFLEAMTIELAQAAKDDDDIAPDGTFTLPSPVKPPGPSGVSSGNGTHSGGDKEPDGTCFRLPETWKEV